MIELEAYVTDSLVFTDRDSTDIQGFAGPVRASDDITV